MQLDQAQGPIGDGTSVSSISGRQRGSFWPCLLEAGSQRHSYTASNAANNGPSNVSCNSTTGICVPSTMMKPRPAGCGAAIAQGAISLGLDVVGAIPAFGNVVSATAAGARAVNGIVAYGGAAYGIATGLPDESPVGAAGAGAGLGLTLADTALEGGKVIPVLGNFLSAGIGLYDGYQLAKTVARCW